MSITHFQFPTKLTWLNHGNKTGELQHNALKRYMLEHPLKEIIACEIGCAYGGGVEMMAKVLGERGKVYGFDTFTGHPKQLALDPGSKEATCMDFWYQPDVAGTEGLSVDYQRRVLASEGITNATLIRGLLHPHSFDDIPYVDFVLMDLDLIASTKIAYEAVAPKVVSGGIFIMHDSIPPDHLPEIYTFVHEGMLKNGDWDLISESIQGLCSIMKKK